MSARFGFKSAKGRGAGRVGQSVASLTFAKRQRAKQRQIASLVNAASSMGPRTMGFSSMPGYFAPTGAEIKAVDLDQTGYACRLPATATGVILLNGVQAGTGFFNRVGARIEMKNLHIRGQLRQILTGIDSIARLLVVYDRQPRPDSGLPIIQDILQNRDQAGTATTASCSEINLDNRDRFVILRDMMYHTPSATYTAGVITNPESAAGADPTWVVNEFIKLKGLGTHYLSTADPVTIANISTGALYAFFVTSGTDSAHSFNVAFRLRYNDK